MQIRNPYYVGHSRMTSHLEQGPESHNVAPCPGTFVAGTRWARRTLDEAIEHARQVLEDNPSQQNCVIVKIVRVVKRMRLPVFVEKV